MDRAYEKLVNAINNGDVETGVDAAVALARSGQSPVSIFSECIEPTLIDVGSKFSRLEIFLPEMMNSAAVVKAVQQAMVPFLKGQTGVTGKGRVVICTVSGDLHDIGKNIVKVMLQVNGFEVSDLGVDVDPSTIAAAAKERDADIVALSALMLASLPYARDTIELIHATETLRDRVEIMVGGGPVSKEWAAAAGADAYGKDAVEAVAVAHRLMNA